MSNNLYGHIIKVSFKGTYSTTISSEDLEIHFEVPFNDDSKPDESVIEIYNLSLNSINKLKKGSTCTLQAGYKGDVGTLISGTVRSVLTRREGTERITRILFYEGEDRSGVKVTTKEYAADKIVKDKKGKVTKVIKDKKGKTQITFKKGTTAKTIINRLCGILSIKPSEITLPKNKVYKKGLVVTGKVLDKLEEVVKDCGAALYYRRGKMVIRSISKGNDESFTLQESTGLIEQPEPFENDEVKGYNVRSLLQHRITVASIINIKSREVNGKYRVKSGKHYYDGNNFMTESEVI